MNKVNTNKTAELRQIALALIPGGVVVFLASFAGPPVARVIESLDPSGKRDTFSWVFSFMGVAGCFMMVLGVLLWMGTILFAPVSEDELR